MNLTEKVAYLKGLLDGMNLDGDDNQVKLIKAVIEVLDEMALSVCDLEDEVTEVEMALDVLDEDLSMLEEFIFDDAFDRDHDHYEVECPICGEVFHIDELTALQGETTCPECDAEIEIEIDEDDDDDDDEDEDDD